MIHSILYRMRQLMLVATVLSAVSLSAQATSPSGQMTAFTATERKINRSRPRRPPPPRQLPLNRVRPGGGLELFAQACDPAQPPLTALVPEANPVYTAAAHPTFFFHMSDAPTDVARAKFVLLSSDERAEIYSAQFVPSRVGIVSVSLPPEDSTALVEGEVYRWYFTVYCQNTDSVLGVNGWVERTTASAPAEEVPTEAGLPIIWYDAIARTAEALASGDRSNGSLSQQQWADWLSAVGLGDIASVPLVGTMMPLPVEPDSQAGR
ncbi:MAG: DUF928 domain-containing protein [Cyanobacteria bacterium J06555_13]